MTHESSTDVQGLWQSQPGEPGKISPEELSRKMHKFDRRIFWRNLREYVAGAFVVVCFGFYEWKLPGLLLRIGSGLIIAGTIYAMVQLHRRASVRSAPADLGLRPCIEFHRRELERQRNALLGIWSWYLLPFAPGFVVFFLGTMVSQWRWHPAGMSHLAMGYGILLGMVGAVFFGIAKLNQRAAAKLQVQIDEMRKLGEPNSFPGG